MKTEATPQNTAPAQEAESTQHKVLTIPNMLSLFRLCLIPLFVWLYCERREYAWTGAVLILSGITDMADGFIARHFHMISDLGKVLDPIADKLTQGATLLCLITRFPMMALPLALLILKELFVGITGLLVVRKTGQVFGAKWHGKITTGLLYLLMILHVFWFDIPLGVSNLMITVCLIMMAVSFVIYGVRNIQTLKGK